MTSDSTQDRLRGCLVGGALGDAVGLFTEFLSAQQSLETYGPNPRFSLRTPAPIGQKSMHMDRHRAAFEEAGWTDDTDQSLLILMSFLHSGTAQTIDPIDFAKRLKFWVQYGFRPLDRLPLGLGRTVGSVVRSEGYLDNPIKKSQEIWDKGGRFMAANGAVMRTPVIGALLYKDMGKLYEAAIGVAETTHADPRCLVSCTIASALIAEIINDRIHSDDDIRRVVTAAIEPVQKRDPPLSEEHAQELEEIIWKDSLGNLQLDERSSIGYTYKCLASGIWALRQILQRINNPNPLSSTDLPTEFERIMTELTMAGGDADTNGAVAGSLVGALIGYSNLPSAWVRDLVHRQWLVKKADNAYFLVTGEGQAYDAEADKDNLMDGGKGEMSKEEIDKAWMKMMEDLHIKCGDLEKLEMLKKGGKKKLEGEGCIVV